MTTPLRFIPEEAKLWTDHKGRPIAIAEVTIRTIQGRYLMKPTPENTDLLLGVISEGLEVNQAEKLVRMRVTQFLSPNAIFISNQLGISKPNPKLYQRACSDLNLRPAESMYVGDNPLHDIDPPNSIGMVAVRMRRGGKYYHEESNSKPARVVQNFWDFLDYLGQEFDIKV